MGHWRVWVVWPQPLEGTPGVLGGIEGSELCDPSPRGHPQSSMGHWRVWAMWPQPPRMPPGFNGGLEGLSRVTPGPEGTPRAAMEPMSSSWSPTPDNDPLLAHPMFLFIYLKARMWVSSVKMIVVFALKKSLIFLEENLENWEKYK